MAEAKRTANVTWQGGLIDGSGVITGTGSGALSNLPVTWASRTERSDGKTSPEELIAAADASCFAMALSFGLAQSGNPPARLEISATCTLTLDGGPKVASIDLDVRGEVPGIDQAAFEQAAQGAAQNCPVSTALKGNVEVRVTATLV
jgi:osmotically inducible protein OsmC